MDLTRTIGYRGFALNTIQFDAVSRDMVGCEVRSVEYGNVPGIGYEEKRAMADGTDVADLYLGKRLISMSGTIYGRTRAEAYRLYSQLAEVMTPTDAYESNPSQRGYLPLDFYFPTDDTTNFPSGLVHAMIFARPMASLSARFDSDRHGGDDNKALAIPWNAQLDARVPWIVNYDYTTMALTGTTHWFTMRNRGNRPAAIEMRLVVPDRFNGMNEGSVTVTIGSNTFKIILGSRASRYTVMYDTHAKVITLQGALRMDILQHVRGPWHPHMPAGGNEGIGGHPEVGTVVGVEFTGTKPLLAGSYLRFRDTWA